jgi:hypothetical protein
MRCKSRATPKLLRPSILDLYGPGHTLMRTQSRLRETPAISRGLPTSSRQMSLSQRPEASNSGETASKLRKIPPLSNARPCDSRARPFNSNQSPSRLTTTTSRPIALPPVLFRGQFATPCVLNEDRAPFHRSRFTFHLSLVTFHSSPPPFTSHPSPHTRSSHARQRRAGTDPSHVFRSGYPFHY